MSSAAAAGLGMYNVAGVLAVDVVVADLVAAGAVAAARLHCGLQELSKHCSTCLHGKLIQRDSNVNFKRPLLGIVYHNV